MITIREIIQRNINDKIEGVVKVFDRTSLAKEFRDYIVTDKIEEELKRIFDTFTQVSEVLRQGGTSRDITGMWISGFFGSGKSHFAKVLGYLLQNDELADGSSERCVDVFIKHLSDKPRGKAIALRLKEIERNTQIKTLAFEIKSRQSLTNPDSVGEILLGEFYRSLGFSENFHVARLEKLFDRRGLLSQLEVVYKREFKIAWKSPDGRDDLTTVRRRLADVLPEIAPNDYPDAKEAKKGLDQFWRYEKLTPEGLADELVAWVDEQETSGKVQHLVFVIDEIGTFIGDSNEKISELNSIAEMIGNKGKGKVWLIVTSQQDLEKVVDRTNFQPALVGRLNARFELKPHLVSDEMSKVVSERILKKHPHQEQDLRVCYQTYEGYLAQLADLKSSRNLGKITDRTFIDCYPFLPHQIRLAQDIFDALSGFRLSGGVRSMISVSMQLLQELADEQVGVVASFDMVFNAVENDLLSQEYLGASGVTAIYEADARVPNEAPIQPTRILKILWLLGHITWVPRVPETLAKLLVKDLKTDIPELRTQVEQTLNALQEAGYVAKDEATGEWKYLNEQERTIEQAIQEMVRPGGSKSISLAVVRRTSQKICKDDLVTKKKLNNFTVTYGKTNVPFPFSVYLDGEAVDTGSDLEILFISPMAPSRKQELEEARQQNQSAGTKGRKVWWVGAIPDNLEARFKRYEALFKVTGDKRFTEDPSRETQDALAEKRKERDQLRKDLVGDLEKTFLNGTLLYTGQEVELEGATDLKEPIVTAFAAIIPNVYTGFALGDRPFDFAKQLRALLNPATSNLHQVTSDLGLFDTQGSLQRESALVSQVLEVVHDLVDEGIDPTGVVLLDAGDRKGFKGFTRLIFGWPDELVRLVLAACFRAGAIYLEQPTGAGLSPLYDYKGSEELFSKINTFKKLFFRVAETSLTVEQLKQAAKCLIAMEVKGVAESGNAIAAAVSQLGTKLKAELQDARIRAEQGLPLPDTILNAETILTEPMTAKDPTKAVLTFLKDAAQWQALATGLKTLRTFLEANRHREFETSCHLVSLLSNHPVPAEHPGAMTLEQARKDMEAIAGEKSIIDRWADYRSAYEAARDAYRAAYQEAYDHVRQEVEATLTAIRSSGAYQDAPTDQRDTVVNQVFGSGGACHYPATTLSSVQSLLAAAAKHSLTSLSQIVMALPGYQSQVETALAELTAPELEPDEKVWPWRMEASLRGRRLRTEAEVDAALEEAGDQLKPLIQEGYTIIVQ
jgi:hypothetical protein